MRKMGMAALLTLLAACGGDPVASTAYMHSNQKASVYVQDKFSTGQLILAIDRISPDRVVARLLVPGGWVMNIDVPVTDGEFTYTTISGGVYVLRPCAEGYCGSYTALPSQVGWRSGPLVLKRQELKVSSH